MTSSPFSGRRISSISRTATWTSWPRGWTWTCPPAGQSLMGGFEQIIQEEVGDGCRADGGKCPAAEGEGRDAPGQVRTDDFNPTLYSLDPTEMGKIQEEIRIEMNRDLRGDVLAALFDRVEEPGFPSDRGRFWRSSRSCSPIS